MSNIINSGSTSLKSTSLKSTGSSTSSSKSPAQLVREFIESDIKGAIKVYAGDPRRFCKDIFGIEIDEWQEVFMRSVSLARSGGNNWPYTLSDNNKNHDPFENATECRTKFAIRSGTGVGKTFSVSLLILWHLAVFSDSKIPCTAPTSPQIKAVLWPEIRKWVARIDAGLKDIFPYDVTTDKVAFYENFAVARTASKERPEAFQGFHSKNVMLIADEASGVPQEIFDAGQGVMSEDGAISIMIGNPTRTIGMFYDAFHRDADMYWIMRVSCLDTGRVSPSYSEMMKRKYGENSFNYSVRVLGEFFHEDSNIIIPLPRVEEAVTRYETLVRDTDYIVWGCDPSDGGRDASALAKRAGCVLLEPVKEYVGITVDHYNDKIVDEYMKCQPHLRPSEIVVDAIGVGTATLRYLKREIGEYVKITPVHVGVPATDNRYSSKRVELWGAGRDWFNSICAMPYDEKLMRELSSVEWEISDSTGKYVIKDKRVDGLSPNKADAFLCTFFSSKARNASLLTGHKKRYNMGGNFTKAAGSASYI